MSDCVTCVTGLMPGVRRGRALAGDHAADVRRAGHALRLVEEDPREVRALDLRTEERYHYEEPHTKCDRVIQRACASSPDTIISVLYRCVMNFVNILKPGFSPQPGPVRVRGSLPGRSRLPGLHFPRSGGRRPRVQQPLRPRDLVQSGGQPVVPRLRQPHHRRLPTPGGGQDDLTEENVDR